MEETIHFCHIFGISFFHFLYRVLDKPQRLSNVDRLTTLYCIAQPNSLYSLFEQADYVFLEFLRILDAYTARIKEIRQPTVLIR